MKTFFISTLFLILTLGCNSENASDTPEKEIEPVIHDYHTFSNQRIAFGNGFKQNVTNTFELHEENSKIETIKMYVKLRCPSDGCNPWDVYGAIRIKDPSTDNWYEIGRFITPYGVDNHQVVDGFEIDVTDFKSILKGTVELKAYIETWASDGWNLSVDFKYTEGTPDYNYYAIAPILAYNNASTAGVPYGKEHNFDLDKSITIPSNSEETSIRTIITGWGHATPTDSDGRPCAEWCYRTHDIKINGANTFVHEMKPIGCAENLVQPQKGNWQPDRAGWCPGMAVPVRNNTFTTPKAGNTFTYLYDFEDWTGDGNTTSGNAGAYYAISSFILVKSNSPISKPTVTN